MSGLDDVRNRFKLNFKQAQFATMVIASHPDDVRDAIGQSNGSLDGLGFEGFGAEAANGRAAVLTALNQYFGVPAGDVAPTHGTTVGLAQILGGIRIRPGQEVLVPRNEHPATLDTLRLRADRDGTPYRFMTLYRDSAAMSENEVLTNLAIELRPNTRILAVSWVSSINGVKLPLKAIAKAVASENARRPDPADHLLLVVDGVHGFGIENVTFPDLGCDFFIAGCHKSLFGPRGTGIICGKHESWDQVVPMFATLSNASDGPASRHIPGGVRAYENWWALASALNLHLNKLMKADVEARVRLLARRMKDGIASIPGVKCVTPTAPDLSSGVVCLDVVGRTTAGVLATLETDGIIGSETSYDVAAAGTHVRFSVSILNDECDVDRALDALKTLAK